MRRFATIATALTLPLGACSTYGPTSIYGANGVIPNTNPQYLSVYNKFILAADRAYNFDSPENAAAMQAVGRDLVEINCHQYYRNMGRSERRSRVTRNLIQPITTALNSLLLLHDWTSKGDTKEDLVSLITIGSAAATSGLDLYDEHFLFKSANIDSVRTMTMKELADHREKMDAPPTSFSDAVRDLVHFENLCTPAHILVTARQRIEGDEAPPQNGGEPEVEPD